MPGSTQGHVGDNVRLAAFITARARSKLVEVALSLGQAHVWYCDTDSLFISKDAYCKLKDL